jgi:hypothetical protein
MEPLVAISLVGNIVHFVDFSSKLISRTVEGYRSADGAFVDNANLEIATNDLVALNESTNSKCNPWIRKSSTHLSVCFMQ